MAARIRAFRPHAHTRCSRQFGTRRPQRAGSGILEADRKRLRAPARDAEAIDDKRSFVRGNQRGFDGLALEPPHSCVTPVGAIRGARGQHRHLESVTLWAVSPAPTLADSARASRAARRTARPRDRRSSARGRRPCRSPTAWPTMPGRCTPARRPTANSPGVVATSTSRSALRAMPSTARGVATHGRPWLRLVPILPLIPAP